jgi:hypothetical protein
MAEIEEPMIELELVHIHESAHAVIARRLGVEVARVVCDPAGPYVTTRHPRGGSTARRIAMLQRLALIDLAGAVIELEPEAADTDEANARRRCAEIIRLRHGGNDVTQSDEAAKLLAELRATVEDMVMAALPEIMQMAAALAAGDLKRVGSDNQGSKHDEMDSDRCCHHRRRLVGL